MFFLRAAETNKSVYEQVVYDSGTEVDFADGLEKNDAIKVYARLPGWCLSGSGYRHVGWG